MSGDLPHDALMYRIGRAIRFGKFILLNTMLTERFGPLSLQALGRLWLMPSERLTELGRQLLRANSLRELDLED